MKLESLNNSKYSLTPEKMGKLVGGAAKAECTDGGFTYKGQAISSDYTTTDADGNTITERYFGEGDVARRDADHSNCNCECIGK